MNVSAKKKKKQFNSKWWGIIIVLVGLLFIGTGILICPSQTAKPNHEVPSENRYSPAKEEVDNFRNKLKSKGYSEADIELIQLNFQDWGWKLTGDNLPDLTTEKRIGVVKQMAYHLNKNLPESEKGVCGDLVIIIRKKTTPSLDGPVIKFDRRLNPNTHDYERRIIDFVLGSVPDYHQLEISFLNLVGSRGIEGESAGVATCLALLSAYYQIPISRQVAAMGQFRDGEISPVGGLRAKITAASWVGVNRLVLPEGHNCLNPSNDIFSSFFGGAESYHQEVPNNIKKKIKPYFVKNYRDLQKLLKDKKLT